MQSFGSAKGRLSCKSSKKLSWTQVRKPTTPTKAIKRLRPNPLAQYELRAGDLRALYNVEEKEVVIVIVGRMVGNVLIVEGEEFHGHQDNPVEPPGNESEKDAE
jgi:hypothetical protein